VHLIPVQLIESVAEFAIFLFLLWYTRKYKEKAAPFPVYLALYAPLRFVLEFFRGDMVRGIFFGLSTSQWIGLAAITCLTVWYGIRRRQRRKKA